MNKRILSAAIAAFSLLTLAGCSDSKPAEEQVTAQIETTETTTFRKLENCAYACFDDCLFLGNSRVETLETLGLAPNADIFARVGLNIHTIYKFSLPDSGTPIIDRVGNKPYKKIIVVFGDNEAGWPYLNVFSDDYTELINKIKQMQPNAEIYLQGVLPISKEADMDPDNVKSGYTMSNINKINEVIKDVAAATGSTFIKAPDSFFDSEGYLPADAASDGIHFGKTYCVNWLDSLAETLGE